jgi:SAM-dependent methyltransferase
MERIDRQEGRRLFGLNPQGYEDARPDYPEWIFERLCDLGVLGDGTATLEIGPGTGRATRKLLERGANPLTLIEPDERFVEMLESVTQEFGSHCTVSHQSFEASVLPAGHFDLAVAATAFHWIEPLSGLRKIRHVLKRDGATALIWNVLQDLDKEDPFHDATKELLANLAISPSGAPDSIPFALNRDAREADAAAAGFASVEYFESRWTLVLNPEQIGQLYEGFSHIQRLAPDSRATVLGELRQIAEHQFSGTVERNVTSCLYVLR